MNDETSKLIPQSNQTWVMDKFCCLLKCCLFLISALGRRQVQETTQSSEKSSHGIVKILANTPCTEVQKDVVNSSKASSEPLSPRSPPRRCDPQFPRANLLPPSLLLHPKPFVCRPSIHFNLLPMLPHDSTTAKDNLQLRSSGVDPPRQSHLQPSIDTPPTATTSFTPFATSSAFPPISNQKQSKRWQREAYLRGPTAKTTPNSRAALAFGGVWGLSTNTIATTTVGSSSTTFPALSNQVPTKRSQKQAYLQQSPSSNAPPNATTAIASSLPRTGAQASSTLSTPTTGEASSTLSTASSSQ